MARHIHDHRGPEYPSDPLRNGCGGRSEGGVGVVVLRPKAGPAMAMAAEAEAPWRPHSRRSPCVHQRTGDRCPPIEPS